MTAAPTPAFAPTRSGLLQRRCACGGTPGPDGACAACRAKRLDRERAVLGRSGPGTAPPVVHEVLRAPGWPLDPAIRAELEPRFGHDFGRVRVHTDGRAAASARAVDALAYTVGHDVVFGAGQYAPHSPAGRQLLAHELAHVAQQAQSTVGPDTGALAIGAEDDAAEREADAAAAQVLRARSAPRLGATAPAVRRLREPYITRVNVDLTPPQSVTLDWKGSPPAEPGSDSFTCSTGKGYSNPGDPPGTCTRSCCSGADVQCAPPYDQPRRVGACCTPIGDSFWTGRPRPKHNGWLYWTPVEPIHTSGGRGIALHQHDEVTGNAIGHGCIRMDEPNAHRIALYSRGKATTVSIHGRAIADCPAARQCDTTGARGALGETEAAEQLAAVPLTQPDEEAPGGGGTPEPLPPQEDEALA